MPRIGRRRPRAPGGGAASPVVIVIVVLAAMAVTGLGVSRLIFGGHAPEAAAASPTASIAGMTAQVTKVEWIGMDHDMSPDSPGYQMPPAMMPGMPTGDDQRLSVAVTLVNTSDETRPMQAAKEFVLRTGKNGKQWSPHSDTFGELPRLAPHNAVTGVIFFDLPPAEFTESPQWIEWTHGGTAARLGMPLDGAIVPPEHPHTS